MEIRGSRQVAVQILLVNAVQMILVWQVRYLRDRVEGRLSPRFPLFGGWVAEFVFGWSLPLASVASRLPNGANEIVLNFGPAIAGVVVDDLVVRVSSQASP